MTRLDEASDVDWNGDVPDGAELWCKALHRLITRVLGDDCKSGGEPEWWSENDDLFIELEEERRGLPRGSLQPFLRQPYYNDLPITEYTTCRNAKVEALLFGNGEQLGDWSHRLMSQWGPRSRAELAPISERFSTAAAETPQPTVPSGEAATDRAATESVQSL